MTPPKLEPPPPPRVPKLRAPRGACDCHNHVFGPIARFPFATKRTYTPAEAPLEAFLQMLDVLGIDRAVIVQPSVYGGDNSCTEDAVARMAGRGRGIAVVGEDIIQDELRRLDKAGFRGVRLNLMHTQDRRSLDRLEILAAQIAPLNWHVQIHLDGSRLPEIADRLLELPVDIVIDHMGSLNRNQGLLQLGFVSLMRLVATGRTWVKLSPYRFDHLGYPYEKAKLVARELAAIRPDRLIWGTDWPHPDLPEGVMPDAGDLLDVLGVWFDDTELIHRILVDNPNALYQFDARPLGS